MSRVLVVAALIFAAGTGVAMADPAAQSTLPWLIEGTGPVARSGRTLFFGNTYGAAPRANRARGLAVFSASEAVDEVVDDASSSDVYRPAPTTCACGHSTPSASTRPRARSRSSCPGDPSCVAVHAVELARR